MSLNFSSIPPKRLAQGITSASSTFYINNILGFDGLTDVASGNLGTQHFCCFRNDTGTRIEIMEIDPTTISTGPITIVRRGLSYYGDLTTETTALKLDWSANETIVQLGTDVPQIFQWLKEYIDDAAVAGAVAAADTVKGIVEQATQVEVDAGTDVGSTGAPLFIRPDRLSLASTTVRGAVEEATQAELTAGTQTGDTGARLSINPVHTVSVSAGAADEGKLVKLNDRGRLPPSVLYFGGTGADGALTVASGTTNIDLGGAQVVVKNYTSISITGTGKVTFSNSHASGTTLIIKSLGNVTLTSSEAPMLDFSALGVNGGPSVSTASSGNTIGNNGPTGQTALSFWNTFGGVTNTGQTGGATGDAMAYTVRYIANTVYPFSYRYPFSFLGSGGASGGIRWVSGSAAATITSGVGGKGGGCLIIECAGAWNFTTANGISVAGGVGGNGNVSTGTRVSAGGGGGGGGGFCFVLYNTLTANSGSINVAGGTGGAGASNESGGDIANGAGGGGGGSSYTQGTAGADEPNGSSPASGGNGGAGLSIVVPNTEFA